MRAGSLTRRVSILYRGAGQDDYGQPSGIWLKLRDTWADIQPLTGGLLAAAQAVIPEATVQVDIRFRSDVVAGMRVQYGVRLFTIGAALDLETKHETLRLLCTEGKDLGG